MCIENELFDLTLAVPK